MSNFKNMQYTAEISLGYKDQKFNMILDTGSANMWIDSVQCNELGCMKHHRYNSNMFNYFLMFKLKYMCSSDHSEKLGYDLQVDFGSGSLLGEINSDTIYFGGLRLPKQNFAEIISENGAIFRDMDFDGILGLAYPQMAAYNMNPVFDNIIQQNKLEKNMFSFYFMKNDNGQKQSEFILGDWDKNLIDGDVHWHKVVDQYYWTLRADKILVDGRDIGLCENGCNVIADTGTSIITVPLLDLDILLKSLDVKNNCNQLNKLPDIIFILDGIEYSLAAEDYVKQITPKWIFTELDQVQEQIELMDDILLQTGSFGCTATFLPLDVPEPQGPAWILGDVFLSKYYSIYDRDNNQVGFGKAKHRL